MADLKTEEKKALAKELFLKCDLTLEEIAGRVGVTRQTIARWSYAGAWNELKASLSITREQQIAYMYRQISEINEKILSRDPGERYATASEADTLNKLAASVKKMEIDIGISDIISVGMRFINWLRTADLDKAKEYTVLWDLFIKDQLAK